jgi:bla regulator protein blaR1
MKMNSFKYVVMAILPITTIAGRVYAHQQTDTAKASVTKTTLAEDDNENNKPNAYQLFGHGDPTLDSLGKQINRYSKVIQSYDHSSAFETLKAKANGFSKPAPTFYNNDTLRHIMAGINKISDYFKTHMSRDVSLKRDSLGQIVGDYFKTEKFTAVNSRLQKKYHIDPAKSYSDDNADYGRYHNELLKKMPANIKDDLQQLKSLSEKQRKEMQSPEFAANIKRLPALIDSMKSYYKKPHVEQYSYASYEATKDVPFDERIKAGNELQAYFKNPEFRHASEMINEYSTKMRDYYQNTPAAKEREDAWKNELKIILADDYDSILHPGRGIVLQ